MEDELKLLSLAGMRRGGGGPSERAAAGPLRRAGPQEAGGGLRGVLRDPGGRLRGCARHGSFRKSAGHPNVPAKLTERDLSNHSSPRDVSFGCTWYLSDSNFAESCVSLTALHNPPSPLPSPSHLPRLLKAKGTSHNEPRFELRSTYLRKRGAQLHPSPRTTMPQIGP